MLLFSTFAIRTEEAIRDSALVCVYFLLFLGTIPLVHRIITKIGLTHRYLLFIFHEKNHQVKMIDQL